MKVENDMLDQIRKEEHNDYVDSDKSHVKQQIDIFKEELQNTIDPSDRASLTRKISLLNKRLTKNNTISQPLKSKKSLRLKSQQSISRNGSKEINQEKGIKEIFE